MRSALCIYSGSCFEKPFIFKTSALPSTNKQSVNLCSLCGRCRVAPHQAGLLPGDAGERLPEEAEPPGGRGGRHPCGPRLGQSRGGQARHEVQVWERTHTGSDRERNAARGGGRSHWSSSSNKASSKSQVRVFWGLRSFYFYLW